MKTTEKQAIADRLAEYVGGKESQNKAARLDARRQCGDDQSDRKRANWDLFRTKCGARSLHRSATTRAAGSWWKLTATDVCTTF